MRNVYYILIYFVFLTTPLESIAIMEGVSIVKIMTILLLFASIFNLKHIHFQKSIFINLYFTYVILILLSSLWSVDIEATTNSALGTIIPGFIVISAIHYSIDNLKQIENIFYAYIIGASIAMGLAIYAYVSGGPNTLVNFKNDRLTVLGQDQNELSFLLSFGIVAVIYIYNFTNQRKFIKLIIIILAFSFAFIILTT